MSYDPSVKLIGDDGLRADGRGPHDLREIKIEAGVLDRADGSCYLEWGENKVLAAVYGPREVHPRHQQQNDRAIVRLTYNMAPFSVSDRKRPGLDRRSQEIGKICSEALESVVLIKPYPKTAIDVFVEIIEASAGTRCAGLTAASVALADAGIPMTDLVTSAAAGKIDNKVVLDLGKAEDNFGQADVPMGVVVRTGDVVLLQMDGDMTAEEFAEACDLTVNACKKIYEIQKDALKNRYQKDIDRIKEEAARKPEPKPAVEETMEVPEQDDFSDTMMETPAEEAPAPASEAAEAPAEEVPSSVPEEEAPVPASDAPEAPAEDITADSPKEETPGESATTSPEEGDPK